MPIEHKLDSLGEELSLANQHRSEVMERIKVAIREADELGVPKEQIMRRLGVAKQTVYDAINE